MTAARSCDRVSAHRLEEDHLAATLDRPRSEAPHALILHFAQLFLREQPFGREYVAIGLLIASAMLGAAPSYRKKRRWSPAMPWMVLAALLLAVASVAEKRV